jgi:hypothetical protein
MCRRQKKDVLANLAHLLGLAVDGRIRGKKGDRVQGNNPDGHVGPAAPLHVFMIQRNDHGDASRLKSEPRSSGALADKAPSGYDTAVPRKLGFILAAAV